MKPVVRESGASFPLSLRVPAGSWRLAAAMITTVAFAHDPFEITADVRVRPDALTLDVTMARSTALAVATGAKEAPTFEPDQFDRYAALFVSRAPQLFTVTAQDRTLAPTAGNAVLSVEGDVEFHLKYPRPPAGRLVINATHLAKLDAGYGDATRVRDSDGTDLGEKLLTGSDSAIEVTVLAMPTREAATTVDPRKPFDYRAAAVALLFAGGLLLLLRRRAAATAIPQCEPIPCRVRNDEM